MATTSRVLPLIKVRGRPHERGVQHGRQCGDLVRRYADVLLGTIRQEAGWRALPIDPSLDREALLARSMAFLPAFEAFAPHLVEEMRGIAEGAKIPFAEVLLVNVRAEVMGVREAGAGRARGGVAARLDGCTAFALGRGATADGSIVAGQNLDQDPLNGDLLVVLHVEPDEGPAALMCSFAGLVGYPGLNSAGIAMFQNATSTRSWRQSGMPHYLMKRVLLEQTTLGGCLGVLRRARLCSSTNYVLADRDAVLDVETTPDGIAVVEPGRDVVVHTNHFVSPSLAPDDALLAALPDSACRAARMNGLIDGQHGRLTLDALKAILSDHDGHPASICRHEERMVSIASLIAEPDHGRLHVAVGNPCANDYVAYAL